MKFAFFLFFFSLFFIKSFSQNSKDYLGAIKLNDSSVISYKVSFIEKNGLLNGYSLTDIGGAHETKSTISGVYDHEKKTLEFSEYGIIYTKSPIVENDFCFINFKGKNINLKKEKPFQGFFVGLFSDKSECINGEIFLSPKEKIEKKMAKVSKIIKKSKKIADSTKEKVNFIKMMDTLKMNMLRNKGVLSVFSKSKDIRLEIYDGGQLDGDKISVIENGKPLVNNFEISSDRKVFSIKLIDKTSLIIKADNVGSISTNTAVIELFFGDKKIRALTNLKKGNTTQIDLFLKE